MTGLTSLLQNGWIRELDAHFARLIASLAKEEISEVPLAAALASSATESGHVCLDLSRIEKVFSAQLGGERPAADFPAAKRWGEALRRSELVGSPGDFCPLILDSADRLYLYRYWEYEHLLAEALLSRAAVDEKDNIPLETLRQSVNRFFPHPAGDGPDFQQAAALTCLWKRFCVIAGGPGTGKTTTVTRILALLCDLTMQDGLRIRLAAPTGKAAARLTEAVRRAAKTLPADARFLRSPIPEASTLHRLLGVIRGSPYFRHGPGAPLPVDVVVVDEASMVDLALMSKLVQALPDTARLILLGDPDQLSSVEAGSVLGDICGRSENTEFSPAACRRLTEVLGAFPGAAREPGKEKKSIRDNIVFLKRNYRFSETGGIGGLSRRINAGDWEGVQGLLLDSGQRELRWGSFSDPNRFQKELTAFAVEAYTQALETEDPGCALAEMERFRILCAVRRGPFGVAAVNEMIERELLRQGRIRFRSAGAWYAGRPVLIHRNDYELGLFNGDVGVALPAKDSGELAVYFPAGPAGEPRPIPPFRLPLHETAFAMTVHKSQGSEFEDAALVLPLRDAPILTRELLYTGVTRVRRSLSIWAVAPVLQLGLSRRVERSSGLRDALWKGGNRFGPNPRRLPEARKAFHEQSRNSRNRALSSAAAGHQSGPDAVDGYFR